MIQRRRLFWALTWVALFVAVLALSTVAVAVAPATPGSATSGTVVLQLQHSGVAAASTLAGQPDQVMASQVETTAGQATATTPATIPRLLDAAGMTLTLLTAMWLAAIATSKRVRQLTLNAITGATSTLTTVLTSATKVYVWSPGGLAGFARSGPQVVARFGYLTDGKPTRQRHWQEKGGGRHSPHSRRWQLAGVTA